MRKKKNKEYIDEQIQQLLVRQQMEQPLKGEPPGPDLGDVILVKKKNKWTLVEKKKFLKNLRKEVDGNLLVRFIVKSSDKKSELSRYLLRKIRYIIYGSAISRFVHSPAGRNIQDKIVKPLSTIIFGPEVVIPTRDDATLYRSRLHFSYQYKKIVTVKIECDVIIELFHGLTLRHEFYKFAKQMRFFYYDSLDFLLFNHAKQAINVQKVNTRDIIKLHTYEIIPFLNLIDHQVNDISFFENILTKDIQTVMTKRVRSVADKNIKNKSFVLAFKRYVYTPTRNVLKNLQIKNSKRFLNYKLNLLGWTASHIDTIPKNLKKLFFNKKPSFLRKINSIFFGEILKNTSYMRSLLHLNKQLLSKLIEHPYISNTGKLIYTYTRPYIKFNIVKAIWIEFVTTLQICKTDLVTESTSWLAGLKKYLLYIENYLRRSSYVRRRKQKQERYMFKRRMLRSPKFVREFSKYMHDLLDPDTYGLQNIYGMQNTKYSAYEFYHCYLFNERNEDDVNDAPDFHLGMLEDMDTFIYKMLFYTMPTHTYRQLMNVVLHTTNKHYLQLYHTQHKTKNNIEYYTPLFIYTAGNLYNYFTLNKFDYQLVRKIGQLKVGFTNPKVSLYHFILNNYNLLDYSTTVFNTSYKNTFYYPLNINLQHFYESLNIQNQEHAISQVYWNEYKIGKEPEHMNRQLKKSYKSQNKYELALKHKTINVSTKALMFYNDIEKDIAYKYLSHGMHNKQALHTMNNTNKLARLLYTNTAFSFLENATVQRFIRPNSSKYIYVPENKLLPTAVHYKKKLHTLHKKLHLHRKKQRLDDHSSHVHTALIYQLYALITRKDLNTNTNFLTDSIYKQTLTQLTHILIIQSYIYIYTFAMHSIVNKQIFTIFKKCVNICLYILQTYLLNETYRIPNAMEITKTLFRLTDVITSIAHCINAQTKDHTQRSIAIIRLLNSIIECKQQRVRQITNIVKYYTMNNLTRITQINHKLAKIKFYDKSKYIINKTLAYCKYRFRENLFDMYHVTEITTTLKQIAISVFHLKSKEQYHHYNYLSKRTVRFFMKILQKNKHDDKIVINRWRTFKELFQDLISNYRTIHLEPSIEQKLFTPRSWQSTANYFASGDYPYPRNLQKTVINRNFFAVTFDQIMDAAWVNIDNGILWGYHLQHKQKPESKWLALLYDSLVNPVEEPGTLQYSRILINKKRKMEFPEAYDDVFDILPIGAYSVEIEDLLPKVTQRHTDDVASTKFLLWEVGCHKDNYIYEPSFFESKIYYLDYIDYIFYKYYILEVPFLRRILLESNDDSDFLYDREGFKKKLIEHLKKQEKQTKWGRWIQWVPFIMAEAKEREFDERYEEKIKKKMALNGLKRAFNNVFEQTLQNRAGLLNMDLWDVNSYDLQYEIDNRSISVSDILFGYYSQYIQNSWRIVKLDPSDWNITEKTKYESVHNKRDSNINKMDYVEYMYNNEIDTVPYQITALRWMIANNKESLRNRKENKMYFSDIQNKVKTIKINNNFDHLSGQDHLHQQMIHVKKSKILDKPGLANLKIIPNYIQNSNINEIYLYRKFVSWTMELQTKNEQIRNEEYTGSIYNVEKVRAIRNIIPTHLLTESYELLSYPTLETATKDTLYQLHLYTHNISYYNEILIPLNLYLKNTTNIVLRNAYTQHYDFDPQSQLLQQYWDNTQHDSNKDLAADDMCQFAEWERDLSQFHIHTVPPATIFFIFDLVLDLDYIQSNTSTIIELISECNKRLMNLTYTGPYPNNAMQNLMEDAHKNRVMLQMCNTLLTLKEKIIDTLQQRKKKNLYINTRLFKFTEKYEQYVKYSYKMLQSNIDKRILLQVPMAFILLYIADLPFITKFYDFISNNLVKNINILSSPYMHTGKLNKHDQSIYRQTIYKVYSKLYDDTKPTETEQNYLFNMKNEMGRIKDHSYAQLYNLSIERRFIWYLIKKRAHASKLTNLELARIGQMYNLLITKNKLTSNKLRLLQLNTVIGAPELRMSKYYTNVYLSPILDYQYLCPPHTSDIKLYLEWEPVIQGFHKDEIEYLQPDFFTLLYDHGEQKINYLELNRLYKYNYNKYKHYLTYANTNSKLGTQYFVRFRLHDIDIYATDESIQSIYGNFMAKLSSIHRKNRRRKFDYQRNLFNPMEQILLPKKQNISDSLYFWCAHYHSGVLYYQNASNIINNKYLVRILQKRLNATIDQVRNISQACFLLHEGDGLNAAIDIFDYDDEMNFLEYDPEFYLTVLGNDILEEWESELVMPVIAESSTITATNIHFIKYLNSLYKTSENVNTYKIKTKSKIKALTSVGYIGFPLNEAEILAVIMLYNVGSFLLYGGYGGSTDLLQYNREKLPVYTHTFFQYLAGWPMFMFQDDAMRQLEDVSHEVHSPHIDYMNFEYAPTYFSNYMPGDDEHPYMDALISDMRIAMNWYPIEALDFFRFELDFHPILRMFTHVGARIWNEQLDYMLLLQQHKFWNINYLADILLFTKLFDQTKKILSDLYVTRIKDLKNEFKKYNLQEETIPAYLTKYHTVNNAKAFDIWKQMYAYGLYEYHRFMPENYAQFFAQPHIRTALLNNFINPKEQSLLLRRELRHITSTIDPYQGSRLHRPEEFFTYPNKRIQPVDRFMAKRVLTRYSFSVNKSIFNFQRTGYEAYPYSYAMNMIHMHHNLLTLPATQHKLFQIFADPYETEDSDKNMFRARYETYLQLKKFFKMHISGYQHPFKSAYKGRVRNPRSRLYFKKETDINGRWESFLQCRTADIPLMRTYSFYPQMRRFFIANTIKASDINLLYKPYLTNGLISNTPIFTLHPSINNKYNIVNQPTYKYHTHYIIYPKQAVTKFFVINNIYGPSTALPTSKPMINNIISFDFINNTYHDITNLASANKSYSRYIYLSNILHHSKTYGPLWSIYHKSMIDSENALHTSTLGSTYPIVSIGYTNVHNGMTSIEDQYISLMGTVVRLDKYDMRTPHVLPAKPTYYPAAAKYQVLLMPDEQQFGGVLITLNPTALYPPIMEPGALSRHNYNIKRKYGRLTMRTLHNMYLPYNRNILLRGYTSYIPIKFNLDTTNILNSNYLRTYYWYHPSFYSTFVKRHATNTRIRAYQRTKAKNPFTAHYHTQYRNQPLFLYDPDVEYSDIGNNINIAKKEENYEQYLDSLIWDIPFVEWVVAPLEPDREKEKENGVENTSRFSNYIEELIASTIDVIDVDDNDWSGVSWDPYNGKDTYSRNNLYKLMDIASSFQGHHNVKNMYSLDFDPFQTDLTTYTDLHNFTEDEMDLRPVNISKVFGKRHAKAYGYDKRPDVIYPLIRTYLPNKIYGQPAHYANNSYIYKNRYQFINIYESFRIKPFAYITNIKKHIHSKSKHLGNNFVHTNIFNPLVRTINKILYPLETQWSAKRPTRSLFLLEMRYKLDKQHINEHIQRVLVDPLKMDTKYKQFWLQKYGRYYPEFPPEIPIEWLSYGIRSNKKHAYIKYNLLFPYAYNRLVQLFYYRPSKGFFPTVILWQYSYMLGFGKTKNWVHPKISKKAAFLLHENFYTKENFPKHFIKKVIQQLKNDVPFVPEPTSTLKKTINNMNLMEYNELINFTQKKMEEYYSNSNFFNTRSQKAREKLIGRILLSINKKPMKLNKITMMNIKNLVERLFVPSKSELKLQRLYPIMKKGKRRLMRIQKQDAHPFKRTYINNTYVNGFLNESRRKGRYMHRKYGEAFTTVHKNNEIQKTYNLKRLLIERIAFAGKPFQYMPHYMKQIFKNDTYSALFLRMSLLQFHMYKYLSDRQARINDAHMELRDYLCEHNGYIVTEKENKLASTFIEKRKDAIATTLTYFRNVSKIDYTKGGRILPLSKRNGRRASDLLVKVIKPRKYSKDSYSLHKLTDSLSMGKQTDLIDTIYNTAYDRTHYWHIGSNRKFKFYKRFYHRRFSRALSADDLIPNDITIFAEARSAKRLFSGSAEVRPFKDAYWVYMAPKLLRHQSNKFYTQELITYKMDPNKPVDWSDIYNIESTSIRGSFTEKQFVFNYKINNTRYNLPLTDFFYYTQYNVDKTHILNLHKFVILAKTTPTIFEDYHNRQCAFIPNDKHEPTKNNVLKYQIQKNNKFTIENTELVNIINQIMQDVSVIGSTIKLDSYLYINSFVRPMIHWGLEIYYNNMYYFDAFYSWTCDFISTILIF